MHSLPHILPPPLALPSHIIKFSSPSLPNSPLLHLCISPPTIPNTIPLASPSHTPLSSWLLFYHMIQIIPPNIVMARVPPLFDIPSPSLVLLSFPISFLLSLHLLYFPLPLLSFSPFYLCVSLYTVCLYICLSVWLSVCLFPSFPVISLRPSLPLFGLALFLYSCHTKLFPPFHILLPYKISFPILLTYHLFSSSLSYSPFSLPISFSTIFSYSSLTGL